MDNVQPFLPKDDPRQYDDKIVANDIIVLDMPEEKGLNESLLFSEGYAERDVNRLKELYTEIQRQHGKLNAEHFLKMIKSIDLSQTNSVIIKELEMKSEVIGSLASQQIYLMDNDNCLICYEQMEPDNMKAPCHHQFCDNCLRNYIENKISSNELANIQCPQEGCTIEYQDNDIQKILPEKYSKYMELKKQQILNQNPNLRWCPKLDCGKYVIGDEDTIHKTCECGQEICFRCRSAWHPDKTCDEVMLHLALPNDIKSCPKCKVLIQKAGGCHHMECTNCKTRICWLCSTILEKNNTHFSITSPDRCKLMDWNLSIEEGSARTVVLAFCLCFLLPVLLAVIFFLGVVFLVVGIILGFLFIWYMSSMIVYSFSRRNNKKYGVCVNILLRFIGFLVFPLPLMVYGLLLFMNRFCCSMRFVQVWKIKLRRDLAIQELHGP
jgi:hypothetical protein